MHKAIVHIGTEKTGTSSLQQFLLANKRGLVEHGLLFPGQEAGQHKIALRAWDGFGAVTGLGTFDFEAYRHGIAQELARHPDATVLLSSEFFHSRVRTTEAMAVLSSTIEDFGLQVQQIIVYFRDQASLAQAAYAEMVKAGRKSVITTGEICSDRYYDHHSIATLWTRQFEPAALAIHSYNYHKDNLIRHFCGAIGVDVDLPSMIWPKHANRTPSPPFIEFLRKLNCSRQRLSTLDVYQQLLDKDTFGHHCIFTADELSTLASWFGPRNERLCSEFGLNKAEFRPHYQDEPGHYPHVGEETFAQLLNGLPQA